MQKTFVALFALGLLAAAPFARAATTERIGLVDYQAVLAQSQSGQAAQAQMKAFRTQQETALKKEQAKLNQEQEALKKNASIETATSQKAAREKFQKDVQAYQEDLQKRQQAMQQKSEELLKPLQAKLYNVIKAYAVSHGYDLILDKGAAIYNVDSIDLTDKILAAFKKAEAKTAPSASGSNK